MDENTQLILFGINPLQHLIMKQVDRGQDPGQESRIKRFELAYLIALRLIVFSRGKLAVNPKARTFMKRLEDDLQR